ncbi:hypothetical protein HDU67_001567 [Dinochytrium kinnereticum]|nr:hypothetical protein HDU67_001567 [Dinochytrium kinnereticum]
MIELLGMFMEFCERATAPERVAQKPTGFLSLVKEVGAVRESLRTVFTMFKGDQWRAKCTSGRSTEAPPPGQGTGVEGLLEGISQLLIATDDPKDETVESILAKSTKDGSVSSSNSNLEPDHGLDWNASAAQLFATWCFISDVSVLREQLAEMWQNQRKGLTSVPAASFVTNLAVAIVQNLEEDLVKQYPRLYHFRSMVDVFSSLFVCLKDDQIGTIRKLFMIPAFDMLEGFARVIQDGYAPVPKAGFFADFDEMADRSKMTDAQKFEEDKSVLLTQLPEVILMLRLNGKKYGDLPFFDAIKFYSQTKRINLSLVFMCQIYLDSVYAKRMELRQCKDALDDVTSRIVGEIDWFSKDAILSTSPGMPTLKQIAVPIAEALKDIISETAVAEFRKRAERTHGSDLPDQNLLRKNPWQCGGFGYELSFLSHTFGSAVLQADGFFAAFKHLYKALSLRSSSKNGGSPPAAMAKVVEQALSIFGATSHDKEESMTPLEAFAKDIGLDVGLFKPASKPDKDILEALSPKSDAVALSIINNIAHNSQNERVQNNLLGPLLTARYGYTPISSPRDLIASVLKVASTELGQDGILNFNAFEFRRLCVDVCVKIHEAAVGVLECLDVEIAVDSLSELPLITGYVLYALEKAEEGSLFATKVNEAVDDIWRVICVELDAHHEGDFSLAISF